MRDRWISRQSRAGELALLRERLAFGDCCALVGVNNAGKSTLLRLLVDEFAAQLQRPRAPATVNLRPLPVYVDFNLLSSTSDREFYGLLVQCLLDELERCEAPAALRQRLADLYQRIAHPEHRLLVPMDFKACLELLCEDSHQVVFLFDEFDEPCRRLDGQVLLNLRAFKDRFGHRLAYVTATGQPLADLITQPGASEFAELFAGNTIYLCSLRPDAAAALVRSYAAARGLAIDDRAVESAVDLAGAHPGLLLAVCHWLETSAARQPAPHGDGSALAPPASVRETAVELLAAHGAVETECSNLWASLSASEQQGLIALVTAMQPPPPAVQRRLAEKGLVRTAPAGPQLFSPLFAHYVRGRVQWSGLEVDVESGDVRIHGQPPRESLTPEETRALILLWQRANRTVSKAELSAAAWGQGYVPGTDDGRLHKFIERLRAKIEPDPDNPTYITTERARGYRLVLPSRQP
jgi:hypothetical protein